MPHERDDDLVIVLMREGYNRPEKQMEVLVPESLEEGPTDPRAWAERLRRG